jgi:hypothetical protein
VAQCDLRRNRTRRRRAHQEACERVMRVVTHNPVRNGGLRLRWVDQNEPLDL